MVDFLQTIRFLLKLYHNYAVTVVKGDHVQDRAATSHVRRELSSVATNGPFVYNIPFCLTVNISHMRKQ